MQALILSCTLPGTVRRTLRRNLLSYYYELLVPPGPSRQSQYNNYPVYMLPQSLRVLVSQHACKGGQLARLQPSSVAVTRPRMPLGAVVPFPFQLPPSSCPQPASSPVTTVGTRRAAQAVTASPFPPHQDDRDHDCHCRHRPRCAWGLEHGERGTLCRNLPAPRPLQPARGRIQHGGARVTKAAMG